MKSTDLKAGKIYAVNPSWTYSNKNSRNPLLCSRRDVLKATLTSMDKYAYEVFRSVNEFDTSFRKTEATKGFGYKVTDGTHWWVARPQDIVGLWDVLEQRWAITEADQKKREEEEQQRALRQQQLREEVNAYAESTKNRLDSLILQITGRPANLSVSSHREGDSYYTAVTLNLRVLDALVERLMDVVG